MNNRQKFKRCLILSGGGSRFAYYLGIHAAAEHCHQAPDLLLASCGGAIAGAIIQGLPNSAERKQWVLSRAMYHYLQRLQVAPEVRLYPQLLRALARYLASYTNREGVARIPDLYADYLVDVSPAIPLPPHAIDGPTLAIVGGRLLYQRSDSGRLRNGQPLFSEVIFANQTIRALLEGVLSPISGAYGSGSVILPMLEVMSDVPVADAVRISLADIFYAQCQRYGLHHYCGGVIDLYPLELARTLATEIAMELKPPFNRQLANPALRAVFGFDGNARLRHVHAQATEVRIDTSDMAYVIAASVNKRIQLLANRIVFSSCSYPEYVATVEAQWQYGFSRGLEGYRRAAGSRVRPRLCNNDNWSEV